MSSLEFAGSVADGAVRLWGMPLSDPAAAVRKVCQAVARDLAAGERQPFLPSAQRSVSACPYAVRGPAVTSFAGFSRSVRASTPPEAPGRYKMATVMLSKGSRPVTVDECSEWNTRELARQRVSRRSMLKAVMAGAGGYAYAQFQLADAAFAAGGGKAGRAGVVVSGRHLSFVPGADGALRPAMAVTAQLVSKTGTLPRKLRAFVDVGTTPGQYGTRDRGGHPAPGRPVRDPRRPDRQPVLPQGEDRRAAPRHGLPLPDPALRRHRQRRRALHHRAGPRLRGAARRSPSPPSPTSAPTPHPPTRGTPGARTRRRHRRRGHLAGGRLRRQLVPAGRSGRRAAGHRPAPGADPDHAHGRASGPSSRCWPGTSATPTRPAPACPPTTRTALARTAPKGKNLYNPYVWDVFLNQIEPQAAYTPWMFATGNHDMEPLYGDTKFLGDSPTHGYGGLVAAARLPGATARRPARRCTGSATPTSA